MDRTRLSDLPAEVQDHLKAMTPADLDLLATEVRGLQIDEEVTRHPADAEGAAKGARTALYRPAALAVDDPLDTFGAIFGVVRQVLAHGSTDDLDRADCLELWKLSDLAHDLLTAHRAHVKEANDRLRAFTHPPGQFRLRCANPEK